MSSLPSLLNLTDHLQVRQFIEMVSGADTVDCDTVDMETENHAADSDGGATNGAAVNGGGASNGGTENNHADSMDTVETPGPAQHRDNSILSNPARFQTLIR